LSIVKTNIIVKHLIYKYILIVLVFFILKIGLKLSPVSCNQMAIPRNLLPKPYYTVHLYVL